MGARKRLSAKKRKEHKRQLAFAKLCNVPTSARKMRLVTERIKGQRVTHALATLKYSKREAAVRLEKLLLSAIANWQSKNQEIPIEEAGLFVKTVQVDDARMLKRLRPAPQGRAHRVRKRSNHVTLILGTTKSLETE